VPESQKRDAFDSPHHKDCSCNVCTCRKERQTEASARLWPPQCWGPAWSYNV